jgi:DNA-binding NarL/FixJ family response regulator
MTACLVVDDHPGIVQAIDSLLRAAAYDVIPCAGGVEGLAALEQRRPAVAVVDAEMDDLHGIELIRRGKRTSPETRYVVYTAHADRALLQESLDAGVLGYVLKTSPTNDLVRALQRAEAGEAWIDPKLTSLILDISAEGTVSLSKREREVIRLLSDGLTNDEIGKKLFISPDTVRTHIRRSITKLGAHNRTEAVAIALRRSLIT